MNGYFECRDEIRNLGLSIERANKIMDIVKRYFTVNETVESKVEEEVSKRAEVFNNKIAEAQKIIDNPQSIVAEMIGKIVCEHLSLDNNSVAYAGNYAELKWDDKSLGEVCIESYPDD